MPKFSLSVRMTTVILAFLTGLILPSCVSTKNAVYFTDIPDSTKGVSILPADFKEPVIQPDDILNISVQTIDPQASSALNQGTPANVPTPGGAQPVSGFLVDKDGDVEVPMLGEIKLSGLTTNEAREKVRNLAAKYYKSPTVQVRFANYKITVIGEVAKPATYTVPNEKVTILDAIGMAGDLTIYGKRENVMVIRDNGGQKNAVRLDLTSSKLFSSPYFYLKQNDVIYVEPGKGKIAANNAARTQTFTAVASLLSLMVVLITRL